MTSCPKCRSIMISVKYEQSWSIGLSNDDFMTDERLRFTCGRCGYSETQPTKDARKQPLPNSQTKVAEQ